MPRQVWTHELVLDNIRELQEREEPLVHSHVSVVHPRLLYAAERYFGSWSAALAAAGVDTDEVHTASKAGRAEKVGKWSRESIVEQIKEIAGAGENMTGQAMRLKYPSLYFAAVSGRYFGSWKNALSEAGIAAGAARVKPGMADVWRSQLLVDRIREITQQYGEITSEIARGLCPEVLHAAEDRFGDWDSALQLAKDND